MRRVCLLSFTIAVCAVTLGPAEPVQSPPGSPSPSPAPGPAPSPSRTQGVARDAAFVPNLGQWTHAARFVHRSGPMTVFLQESGWVIDVAPPDADDSRAVALEMSFADSSTPTLVGESEQTGHHDYFLGDDQTRWRTEVPLYDSVRYTGLYPGVDVRMRHNGAVPEYDLLLEPHADLEQVRVTVTGSTRLSLAADGDLVLHTPLGTLTQPRPTTWQVDARGQRTAVPCDFVLLGADQFGFAVDGWDRDAHLTIDPGLLWSTFLGGTGGDSAWQVDVDDRGFVTVAGLTDHNSFPTTRGVYDTTHNGNSDFFVSRFDPRRTGSAQLIYSTFLGGSSMEDLPEMHVADDGVVTLASRTGSGNFPTTRGAYDTTFNGRPGWDTDLLVCRLDPRRTGTAQLVYSTFLGGDRPEWFGGLTVDSAGAAVVTGYTWSSNYPTTAGAYDRRQNAVSDCCVSRLILAPIGQRSLNYSTYFGGNSQDWSDGVAIGPGGKIVLYGHTRSTNLPTTSNAFDRTYNGTTNEPDGYISCLDPSKQGTAQLVYSTYLGGAGADYPSEVHVDPRGVITLAGSTFSKNFPTTPGAYDRVNEYPDAFVTRLDPTRAGSAQLLYSTFLGAGGGGGIGWGDGISGLHVDPDGVVTVAGSTSSRNFPVTPGAYDTTFNVGSFQADAFVSRLDPRRTGRAQLVYSTFLGGSNGNAAADIDVDPSGVATVTGHTASTNFPTTAGAYDRTLSGRDAFVSRLDLNVPLYADVHAITRTAGGTQRLTVNAGRAHARRNYWILGSVTGTKPGVNLLGVHIPLNLDPYTDLTIARPNSGPLSGFRGVLDANGLAAAAFRVPANLPVARGFTFHHACVVYDASGRIHLVSNAVPLRLE